MNLPAFLLSVVVGLMLAETRVSARNTRRLLERGGIMPAGDVYPIMAVVYPLAFLAMGAEGMWRASAAPVSTDGPYWPASGILLFLASKGLKYWAISALGERWTFRVVVIPNLPLVTTGPYRYVAHPNYIGVVGELVGAAMMFRAAWTGPVMVALFGLVLWVRVRFETRVLGR